MLTFWHLRRTPLPCLPFPSFCRNKKVNLGNIMLNVTSRWQCEAWPFIVIKEEGPGKECRWISNKGGKCVCRQESGTQGKAALGCMCWKQEPLPFSGGQGAVISRNLTPEMPGALTDAE